MSYDQQLADAERKGRALEDRVKALEQVLPSAVLDAIYADPHQWSERPCPTCRSVTNLTGRPFGCERFQAERRKARQQ